MKSATKLFLLAALAASLTAPVRADVETYAIDPVHSSVGFSIRHFVSKVPGSFTKFAGTITVDRANLENSSVQATIDIGSGAKDPSARRRADRIPMDASLRSA